MSRNAKEVEKGTIGDRHRNDRMAQEQETGRNHESRGMHDEGEAEKEGLRHWATILSAFLVGFGLVLMWLAIAPGFKEVIFGIALGIAVLPVFREAFEHARENFFNADFLMGLAAIGAALIGVWEEGAMVLLLYNVAESIEDYTVDKVRNIVTRMAHLLPKRALAKRDGMLEEVAVESLRTGDEIVVKPGWRIPVDGRILVGSSTIDTSAITGESIPVEKTSGDEVLSGTLNIEGSLEIRVEKPFSDSTINRIIRLVMAARERKTSIERVVDKFSRRYTPTMLLLALGVMVIPPVFFGGSWPTWVYRSLIVLIIACPSAFVIATPVTVLMGLTRAMWSGVLVKGGIYLEEIARVRAVAFDKTGTLTQGRLKVAEVYPGSGHTQEEVLRFATVAEAQSSHPISQAIMEGAKDRGIKPNGDVELVEVPGKGIIATFKAGDIVIIGKSAFLAERGITPPPLIAEHIARAQGTVVSVAVNASFIGVITIADEIRPEAKQAIEALYSLGVDRVEILTGDVENTARYVAEQVGVHHYLSGLLPEEKVSRVNRLRELYGSVVMVGDGMNDAPVLAASSVGIAVGTAGNDIALEAADIALVNSDLTAVPYTIQLGQKVSRKLKINIGLTLFFKILVIVLGALGVIPLWFAVIGDDGMTLIILANALPLLRFKKPLPNRSEESRRVKKTTELM